MKKLRLKALSLGAREILNREQLKSITGGCSDSGECLGGYCDAGICRGYDTGDGSGSGSGSGSCPEGYEICESCGCQIISDCDRMGGCV